MNRITARLFASICFAFLLLPRLAAQDTVRVMTYNLLRYGASGISCTPTPVTTRNPWFTSVIQATLPDIFGVNEVGPFDGPTSPSNNILINILRPINPAYKATQITFNTYTTGQDVANMMYYNSDVVELASQDVIPETNSIRDLNYYKFYYKGPGLATGDTTFIEVVQVHLHSSAENTRAAQTSAVMAYLNGLGRPGNFIVQGDFNLDGSSAGSYQNMVAYSNADCKMNDPINFVGNWHNNNNFKRAWSQSTRATASACGSGGGLDDRFDIILASNALMNGSMDVTALPSSYWVVGNSNSPNPAVDANTQAGIIGMSDHHPVAMDLVISKAVAIEESWSGINLKLQGNPIVDGQIRLLLEAEPFVGQTLEFELLDLQGRSHLSISQTVDAAKMHFAFDVSALAKGVYLLKCGNELGSLTVQRVLLQ